MTAGARETVVVICPGRGSYNAPELGYLQRYHRDKPELLAAFDRYREERGQPKVTELDQGPFQASVHCRGDNASALIHACALADFLSIDQDRYEIVAVTGNSLGWYLALACTGALDRDAGIHLVNTMGTLMQREGVGGQIIYPLVGPDWRRDETLENACNAALEKVGSEPGMEVYESIKLGGMRVIAASEPALERLLRELPPVGENYPLRLHHHGGFHSPLMGANVERAQAQLGPNLFSRPQWPLVDGKGRIWQPASCSLDRLYQYTLGQQIQSTYDYTQAIKISLREYAPDRLILLGPGTNLGGPTAQVMIRQCWWGLENKKMFTERQQQDPVLLSMGMASQRSRAVKNPDR